MATTQLDIWNQAVAHVGGSKVTSLDTAEDSSVEANACRIFYNNVKQSVLREYVWTDAKSRAILSPLNVPSPVTSFKYTFAVPADCLKLLRPILTDGQRVHYAQEDKKLLSNASKLEIIYVRDIPEAKMTDPLLVSTIAGLLAWRIAYKVTQDKHIVQLARETYLTIQRQAKSMAALEKDTQYTKADLMLDSFLGLGETRINKVPNV